jgi:hypothetical protein
MPNGVSHLGCRFARRADLALLGLAGAALVSGFALMLGFGFGRDQGIYAVVGEAVTRGSLPYRDAWDFKPPAIFLVYALARALGGSGMVPVRVLEVLALASLVPAFAAVSRRCLGDARPGLVAAAVAGFAQVQLEFWDTAQPETFGGVAVAWALAVAAEREGRARWLGAGALYGLAGLFKPHLGAGLVVTAAFAARDASARGASAFAPLGWLVAGAAVPVACVGAWLAPAWRETTEVFGAFVPAYHALRFEWAELPALLARAFFRGCLGFTAYLPAGLALLALLGPRTGPAARTAVHALALVAIQLVGVALQARFYAYHFGASLTLLALPAGWGLWRGWLRLRDAPLRAALAFALIGVLALRAPEISSYTGLGFWQRVGLRISAALGHNASKAAIRLHVSGDVHPAADLRVAHWLATRTPPEASVYVWGFEPVIYELSGRRPASRYIYNVPQRLDWSGHDAAREQLLEDLRREQPEAVVVVARDTLAGVCGDGADSRTELEGWSELRDLLARHYRPAGRFEDLQVLVRHR